MLQQHPIYAINIKERKDRLLSIQNEFEKKEEFRFEIIMTEKNENGALGLWENIVKIINEAKCFNYDYVIICEDDHQFTESYSCKTLKDCILEAQNKGADILLGGVSWFKSPLQISRNLFWLERFSGLQFTVVFNRFFDVILNTEFGTEDAADYKISELTQNKFFIHPFISTQADFGYSDATDKNNNNRDGYFTRLFEKSSEVLMKLKYVKEFYTNIPNNTLILKSDFDEISIPVYVINLPKRTERLLHIKEQLKNRKEFEVTMIEACKDKIGAVGLWKSIRKIINIAIDNDDDVIIICEDDHEFTSDYSWNYLLTQILEGNEQGIELLSGGIGGFGNSIPITKRRFWIDMLSSTQFIVLYKNIFTKILNEPYGKEVTADGLLSELSSSKMVMFPYISRQKDFGYSDITAVHNEQPGIVQDMFENAQLRLRQIQDVHLKYSSK